MFRFLYFSSTLLVFTFYLHFLTLIFCQLFEGRNGIIGVRLTPVQKFALRIRRILLDAPDGHVSVSDLEHLYRQRFNEKLRCRQFGFANLIGLLRAASHVLYMKGRGQTLCVCINRNFLGETCFFGTLIFFVKFWFLWQKKQFFR